MAYSDIIKSAIVEETWNPFWDDISELVKELPVRAILILGSQYAAGSAEEIQLQKMLGACKLEVEQYNIIQLEENQKIAWHKLRDSVKPETILLAGIHPMQIGISALFKLNEVNHFNDRIFIPTLSLTELERQPEMKKQLWNNGLKPVFID